MARVLILLAAVIGVACWYYARRRGQERTRDRIAHARADFLGGSDTEAADERGHKEIAYRGGLVRFRIPETWREEYGAEGGGTFFDPASDQRILRLHALTIEKPGHAGPEELAFLLGSLRPHGECALTTLPDGQLLLKYVDAGREDGQELVLYTWQLARSVSADRARIAVFTLTVPAEAALDVLTRDDRRRLERCVRAAQVAGA